MCERDGRGQQRVRALRLRPPVPHLPTSRPRRVLIGRAVVCGVVARSHWRGGDGGGAGGGGARGGRVPQREALGRGAERREGGGGGTLLGGAAPAPTHHLQHAAGVL